MKEEDIKQEVKDEGDDDGPSSIQGSRKRQKQDSPNEDVKETKLVRIVASLGA